ncbi:MAG: Ig-like domain-containing protein [Chloroflexales bacterium]|nr:Ig-like domain-containing protein [Chloroflexales bacterium]
MRFGRFVGLGMLLVLLGTGAWVLARPVAPAPESATGAQARLRALAPAGEEVTAPYTAALHQTASDPIVHTPVRPTVVDLRTIRPGQRDPNSQLDRWQRGEIDLDERDGIVSAAELQARQDAARQLPPDPNVQIAADAADRPSPSAPSQGIGFDSLDYTECCGGGGNVPPDPELAVGPNHIIAVVNVAFEIYDKNGTTLRSPTTFASFFGSTCPSGVFDPNVLYDESADRFFMGIDQRNQVGRQSNYCVAASQTSDPTGAWNLYAFDMNLSNTSNWMDYPHAGVGRDAIYMGGNMFSWQGSFVESRVWAFNKSQLYAGESVDVVERGLNPIYDTPQPLELHGWNQGTWPSSGPHYFIGDYDYNGVTYAVLSWDDPFGANSLNEVGVVDLQAATGVTAGFPIAAPQSGGGTLDTGDVRPLDFVYRNGSAWTTMTIGCNPGGGTVNCVRWAEIDPATATVRQSGVLASDGDHRYHPDLAVNACADMAVGYTQSSSSIFPGAYVTGRQSSTPPNTLEPETLMKAGEINYTSFEAGSPRRWGDYTGMTIDPDGQTFWYLGEYSKDTGTTDGRWGNYIGSFSYAACSGGGAPTPTPPTPTNTPVTDTPTPTAPPATDTPTATNTPAPGDTVMYVSDIAMQGQRFGRFRRALATVTILDSDGNPVSGATVSGSWSGDYNATPSGTTNANGQVTFASRFVRTADATFTFTVDNVTASGLAYDPDLNNETSDTIVIP